MTEIDRYEAKFYESSSWDSVVCQLCSHRCAIAPSRSGQCGVRINRDGKLYLEHYGKLASMDVVYSENLPLFHYKPEINWMRLGSKGCTMACPFCSTAKYSQIGAVSTRPFSPTQIVEKALSVQCRGISFGVAEPASIHEYVEDVFATAKSHGVSTHVATSGMWSPEALRDIANHIDAVTIGLKGFDPNFYQRFLNGDFAEIIKSVEQLLLLETIHVEISYLLIPGITDNREQAESFRTFVEERAPQTPILIIPYRPDFMWKTQERPGDLQDMKKFKKYFEGYGGPIYLLHPESADINTRCCSCGRTLVRRGMARAVITSQPGGGPKDRCPSCNEPVPYVIDE